MLMENRNQIVQELRGISPFWEQAHSVPTPYMLPEGYFTRLEKDLGAALFPADTHDTPRLLPHTGQAPYQVPEQYFEKLEQAVLQQVRHPKHNRNATIPVLRKLFRYTAAAALAGIFLMATWYFWYQPEIAPGHSPGSTLVATDSIPSETLWSFLDQEIVSATLLDEDLVSDTGANFTQQDMLASVPDSELEAFINSEASIELNLTN